jgi:hypothetical protein
MNKEQKIELISKRIQMLQALRNNEYAFMKEAIRDRWESNSEKFGDMLKAEVTKLEEALSMPDVTEPDQSMEEHA